MGDLDEQYKTILKRIKHLILNIEEADILSQSSVWLEKLNTHQEKRERNSYLLELVRQIESGKLSIPFINSPPAGPLTPLTKIIKINANIDDEDDGSSWMEISDITSPGDGDKGKPKIVGLQLKEEGLELKKLYSKKFEEDREKEDINNEVSTYGALENKIKDLVNIKRTLQEAQQLSEEWKNKYYKIQEKLREKENENLQLRSTINTVNEKMSELQDNEDKEKKCLDQELGVLKKRLVDNQIVLKNLKTHYEQQIQQLKDENDELKAKQEKKCIVESELLDLKTKLENKTLQCHNYQSKYKEISTLNEDLIRRNTTLQYELEAEKVKLRNELQKSQHQEEHIDNLRRSISKTEKLYHKLEKDCNKKIEQMKLESEIKEQSLEIKMKNEKLECLSRHNTAKQAEFDKIIQELEEKYKKFAFTLQAESLEIKRKNEEVIEGLKSILDKSGLCSFRS